MGYEVKLIIGKVCHSDNDDLNYFHVDAMVELGKSNIQMFGCLISSIKRCYFYGTDGNTKITKDSHDAEFYPHKIQDVIKALKEEPERQANLWALALLESMNKNTKNYFSVLFFGH